MAQIMYVARGEPSRRKVFNISADYTRYTADISRIRDVTERFGGGLAATDPRSRESVSYRGMSNRLGEGVNWHVPRMKRHNVIRHAIRSQRMSRMSGGHPNASGSRSEAMR